MKLISVKSFYYFCLCAFVVGVFSSLALGQPNQGIRVTRRLSTGPSTYTGADSRGDLVYAPTRGSGLTILDVSRSDFAREIGSTGKNHIGLTYNNFVTLVGDRALFGATDTLFVVDVSDPTNPFYIAQLPMPAMRCTVKDTLAFVIGRDESHDRLPTLTILNISNIESPQVLAEINSLPEEQFWISTAGNYILLPGPTLRVYDISDPRHPRLQREYSWEGISLPIEGNLGYLNSTRLIRFLDLSDIENIVVTDSMEIFSIGCYMGLYQNHLYYDDDSTCFAMNLETREKAAWAGGHWFARFRVDQEAGRLYPGGSYYTLADPLHPQFFGEINLPMTFGRCERYGDRLLTQVGDRFMVIDWRDGIRPEMISNIEFGYRAYDMKVRGDTLWVTGTIQPAESIVEAYDIVDPANPELIGRTELNGWYGGNMEFYGDTCYIFGEGYFNWFDATNPNNLVRLGRQSIGRKTFISDYAFAPPFIAGTTDGSGLHVYSINPGGGLDTLFEWQPADSLITSIDIEGDRLYALINQDDRGFPDWGALLVIDLSNPDSLTILARYELYSPRFVFVRDGICYVQVDAFERYVPDQLIMIDYNDLENPRELGSAELPTGSTLDDYALNGDNLVISAGSQFTFYDLSEALEAREEHPALLPSAFACTTFPNPFNSSLTIKIQIPKAGDLSLTIYDLRGRVVSSILSGWTEAGVKNITWSAANIPCGIYYLRMNCGGFTIINKVLLMR